jgi:hypothetical protein
LELEGLRVICGRGIAVQRRIASGGRAKRYFRVTKAGLQQVRKTQKALVALWQGLPQLERGKA